MSNERVLDDVVNKTNENKEGETANEAPQAQPERPKAKKKKATTAIGAGPIAAQSIIGSSIGSNTNKKLPLIS